MYRKKNLIIIVMIIVVLLMAVGYAAFQTQLKINGTGSITSKWGVEITNISSAITGSAYNISTPTYTATTASFNAGLKVPGDKIEYTVTVKNSGTVDAIIDRVDAKVEGSYAIVYSITGIQSETKLASGVSKSFKVIVTFDRNATSIPSDTTKKIDMNIICIQDDGQSLTPSFPTVEGENTLTQKVLFNNTVKDDDGLHFANPAVIVKGEEPITHTMTNSSVNKGVFATGYTFDDKTGQYTLTGTTIESTWPNMNNSSQYKNYPYTCFKCSGGGCTTGITCETMYEVKNYKTSSTATSYEYTSKRKYTTLETGLYQTSTNTEGGKKTYYFRGNPTNNYVKFAGFYWRIIRINEDGSVRLIYQGTDANTTSCLSGSKFNGEGNNAIVGFMYGSTSATDYTGTHLGNNNSLMKTALDSWYEANLTAYSKYLADSGFCNDRSIAPTASSWASDDTALGYGANKTYYGAYNRMINLKKPQFKCTQANDLFTTSTSSKGNKKLKYPIGLITADEAAYAGMNYYTKNSNKNTILPFYAGECFQFTMTPATNNSMYTSGSFDANMNVEHVPWSLVASYRPVINLKSTVQVKSGNGTSSSPYEIKEIV